MLKFPLTLLLIVLIAALLFGPARAQTKDWWTITLIGIDYDKRTVTLRIEDLDALVRSHNQKVDTLVQLRKGMCI